jgi:hypothetical protein
MNKGKVVDIRARLGITAAMDELATVFNRPGAYLADATTLLRQGLIAFGKEALVRELCRRLSQLADKDDSTYIVWALGEIRGEGAVQHLRQVLHSHELSSRVRTEAAMILHALGIRVDPQELPLQPFQDIQEILSETERQVEQVNEAERAFVLNELFEDIGRFMGDKNVLSMLRVFVTTLIEQPTPIAADMLWTLGQFGPENIRPLAARSLETLKQKGFEPSPVMIAGVYEGVFAEAWMALPDTDMPQGQLFAAWRYEGGRMMVISFLIDFSFWGGAAKDFFIRPSLSAAELADMVARSKAHGIPMESIDQDRLKVQVRQILQAHLERGRPLPEEYRRFHPLVESLLFETGEISLPSLADEETSPLPEAAAQVEDLLRGHMPNAQYAQAQVLNARMLWRDFFERYAPRVGKAAVWAAAVEYIIGQIESRYEQTQQVVAERYAVSVGSVSRRSGEIWDRFLDVEQSSIAYSSDKNLADFSGILEDFLGEELEFEDPEADYEAYLDEYELTGRGMQRLTLEDFVRFSTELDRLEERADLSGLDLKEQQRFEELTHLLLLD